MAPTSVSKDLFNKGGDESSNSLLRFEEYLQILLLEKAKGFVYDLAYDSDGTINGAVWQTGRMCDNFECFGGFICVDAMKRGINKLLWPYPLFEVEFYMPGTNWAQYLSPHYCP